MTMKEDILKRAVEIGDKDRTEQGLISFIPPHIALSYTDLAIIEKLEDLQRTVNKLNVAVWPIQNGIAIGTEQEKS